MDNYYIALDVETGGLGKEVSLLTAYFAILDKELNIVNELDLSLIPDDGIYKVQPTSLEINKIDLKELAKKAITYKEAKSEVYNFLTFASVNLSGGKLIPIGQNVGFDIEFVTDTIISKGSWDNFVSRRILDTMIIANFLKQVGKLSVESVSLGNLIQYFGIEVEGVQHEAKYDTLATVEVYKKLVAIIK